MFFYSYFLFLFVSTIDDNMVFLDKYFLKYKCKNLSLNKRKREFFYYLSRKIIFRVATKSTVLFFAVINSCCVYFACF